MNRNSRRNIRRLRERIKRLRWLLKESERNFYIELGKAVEKELLDESENLSLESLKRVYSELKEKYGV